MADESGSNPLPGKEQLSSSQSPKPLPELIRRPLNLLPVEDVDRLGASDFGAHKGGTDQDEYNVFALSHLTG